MTLKKPWNNIRCVETGAIFLSIADAHEKTGVSGTKIRISLASGAVVDGVTFIREKYGELHPPPPGQDFLFPLPDDVPLADDDKPYGGGSWVRDGDREFVREYRGQKLQCNQTGEEFESIAEASDKLGVGETQIRISLASGVPVNGYTFERIGVGVVRRKSTGVRYLPARPHPKAYRSKRPKTHREILRETLPMRDYFKALHEEEQPKEIDDDYN